MLDTRDSSVYKVIELHGIGYSNSHGNNAVREINRKRNDFLAEQRCSTVLTWFKANYEVKFLLQVLLLIKRIYKMKVVIVQRDGGLQKSQ